MNDFRKVLGLISGILLLTSLGCAGSAPVIEDAPAAEFEVSDAPRNVIQFVCDGCGPAAYTVARDLHRHRTGEDFLAIDAIQTGSVHTYSTDSRITDSAAGATALAAGVKTYNGAIGVDTLRQPVATVLEGARERGMATGMVTSTRITHATPASFAAHVERRSQENAIAAQIVEAGVDLLIGAGLTHFLPESADGAREDGRDLVAELRTKGYEVATDYASIAGFDALPVAGLIDAGDLPFEVDRSDDELSLAELTAKAIELLSERPEGFFLMVEAARVDHAEHDNDLAGAAFDMLAYDQAMAVALDFARRDGRTLIVATSDHETGGLTLGRKVEDGNSSVWDPGVVNRITASHSMMADRFLVGNETPGQVIAASTGLDSFNETEQAMLDAAEELREAMRKARAANDRTAAREARSEARTQFRRAVGAIVSRHAVAGWTSFGHTAVDVPLFAFGPGSERFVGHFDNTHVGRTIADLMNVDLEKLTEQLRRDMASR